MTEQFSDFVPNEAQAAVLNELSKLINTTFLNSLAEHVTEDSPDSAQNHLLQKSKKDELRRTALNLAVPQVIVMALDFEPYSEHPQFQAEMLETLKLIADMTKEEEKYLRDRFNLQ